MSGADRFKRTRLLFGEEGMARLSAAKVLVVGLGAVGSYCVEALARSGVGSLRLVDFDVVDLTNINRQLYALGSTVGRSKVDVARARVADIAPDCAVDARAVFARGAGMAELLDGNLSYVVDAIDTLNSKVALCEAAVRSGLPIVSAMGAARRRDPTLIRIGPLSETRVCPLARFVRQRLRKRGIENGITCVYSDEPCGRESLGDRVAAAYDPGRGRHELGSYACVTGAFGLAAASHVIRSIVEGRSFRSDTDAGMEG